MPPRSVALIAAACLTTGWLLASLIAPPIAELQVLPERTPPRDPRPSPPVEAPYTELLHIKLQQAPLPPIPRRNPFVFGGTSRDIQRPARSSPGAEPQALEPSVPASVIPSGPSLTLSGIGSTETPKGPVLTAVISDGQSVHLAKIGDVVAGYAVVEIGEHAVTIANAAGAQWILRLR